MATHLDSCASASQAGVAAGGSSTLAGALDVAVGAALLLDPDLRVVLASPLAERLLGRSVPAGLPAPDLLCDPDADRRPVALAMGAAQPFQSLVHVLGDDGVTRAARVRGSPVPGGAWLLLLEAAPLEAASTTAGPLEFHGMWTQDDGMKACFRIAERVAETDDAVLVRGETGAGKELLASAIHRLSPRRNGPYKALNCAALPTNLLESELFGHVRGSFTGAHKDTQGYVQLAHGGTLFLDEVAELPLELQAKLLRVVETRTVIPVGAREPIAVDVRIVSATHRALRAEVEAGRFRADLMYRLRVLPVFLPPLRQRVGDVQLLTERFLTEFNATRRRQVDTISPAALTALERWDWPGNVRELRNVLAYAHTMGDGPVLELGQLPPEIIEPRLAGPGVVASSSAPPASASQRVRTRARLERAQLQKALEESGGNRNDAARRLGVSRITLWRHMRDLGLADTP